MGNSGGIEPHFADLLLGAGVILYVHGVGEKKLRFPLLAVALQGYGNGGADEYALLFPILGYHQSTLLDSEASAQSGRDNHGPPLPDPTRALGHPGLLRRCLII